MGMSPSADLYWGFDLGDLCDPGTYDSLKPAWMEPEDDDEGAEWDEELARRLGWTEAPFPPRAPSDDWRLPPEGRDRIRQEFRATPEYQAWSASRDELHNIIKQIGVELDTYGYHEEPSYSVRVKASVQRVDDWGSVALEPLVVADGWRDQIMRFMELLELPVPEGKEPGWHMNCSYG